MKVKVLFLVLPLCLALSACTTTSRSDRAVIGGAIGMGAGAAATGSVTGALGGTALGAILGAATY